MVATGEIILLTCTTNREQKEYAVFKELLRMVPSLEVRLVESSEETVTTMAELVSG